ncbi:xanthine dehydrogenase family protein molybdopterin-binding subunit [Bradyrhizobium sp. Arg237L]|uniref:xanthine dehydrogenase family protein molybdopterin-binding subunit n=1 Tax=Bradyrhizobium sp. Arg237L TaxID=3003352 RepID=UPI00249DE135|nr:xanthine dehydrogenase family protein molybdopterin-binding subunit [Bradyrhizobium sp. Arg237L]MDI4234964.1 xanthine dehydrogenase family protein molybdopterin-binding subunit [Bradyrhizobium sp. Arg237L]
MTTRFFGAPVKRNEDRKLLTGQALFVDDVELPGMLHAAFLRSQAAHARIERIDVSRALQRPGVVAVYTADDYGTYWQPGPLLVPPPPIPGSVFNQRTQVPLAKDKVRHVGEPLAVVVAESRYIAEDALDDIDVDLEPLAAVIDLEAALRRDSALVHDDLGSNISAHVHQSKGDYRAAAAKAHLVIKRRFAYEHGIASTIETRGVVAHWEPRSQHMTIWDTTQAPVFVRNGLAAMLGLGERQVRVIAPFVGGGFGPKIMMFYPEEVALPWISMRLNRPVKWIEDRLEHFFATTHERGQIHDAEIAVTRDGRILGVKDVFLHDGGAYDPYGLTVPINSQCTLLGPYVVPSYDATFTAVFTNLPIVTPYRGAGRQHGVFVMERLLDLAAHELNIDPAEIRRRNLIPADAFPYKNGIIYQDFSQLEYDSGNYEPVLDQALQAIGYAEFKREQEKLRAQGRHVGIGIACYVEGTGIGPYEGARVQVQANGKVSVATGIGTQGQGHFTSFAQIVADQLGVDVTDVDIVTGDTDQFYWGAGTFASRGAVVAGNAVNEASRAVRQKALKLASDAFECAEEDLVLADGKISIVGIPEKFLSLGELARRANPMRGAVKPGTEPGLESTQYFGPPSGATANGVHAMIVEVDPDTFDLKILKYVVVHDCGTVINPLILEGQIHGGVAQGIGNAFYEKLVFDDQGQLLNASLADYLLPTALEVPRMELGHTVTPSPLNPMGIKGAGEAGAIPVGPLFAQAIEDALQLKEKNVELLEIPLSPSRIFELIKASEP